jgi:hypothetical protein
MRAMLLFMNKNGRIEAAKRGEEEAAVEQNQLSIGISLVETICGLNV